MRPKCLHVGVKCHPKALKARLGFVRNILLRQQHGINQAFTVYYRLIAYLIYSLINEKYSSADHTAYLISSFL